MLSDSQIIRLNSVDSTNNYAAKLLKQTNLPEYSLIVTKRQENGKGQRGTKWHSAPGQNFTGTFILYPQRSVNNFFVLQKATACAAMMWIQEQCPEKDVSIKWPNDLYVGDKKIGGILLESQVRNKKFEYVLLGLGININQENWENPQRTTSVINQTGKKTPLKAAEEQLQEKIYQCFWQMKEDKIDNVYNHHLYAKNLWKYFVRCADNKKIKRKISGVSQQGFLLLTTPEKKVEQYDIKEIKFI